ncbi:MAG: DUF2339 domain-containing protein [Stygiobacter sp.]|nr:MAG: DUF2339 domain-containing protein [Stygiobacter sp.]
MESSKDNTSLDLLSDRMEQLEKRILSIENRLELKNVSETLEDNKSAKVFETDEERDERYESTIGQSWMALIGTIVITTGLCFSLSLSYESLPAIIPPLIGFVLTLGMLGLSFYTRDSYANISKYLVGGAMLLFYFSTLRLHFFVIEPVAQSLSLEIFLLTAVTVINVLISLSKKSIYLFCLSLSFGFITLLINPDPVFMFASLTVMVSLSVYIQLKFSWEKVTFFFMPLTYLSHLLWFILHHISPETNTEVTSVFVHSFFISIYSAIFFAGVINRKEAQPETISIASYFFFNSGLVLLVTFIIINTMKVENYAANYFLTSILFIAFAVILWVKEKSEYSTFFNAMAGYFALSLAIISLKVPNYLIWLCWQSLLVTATAVWFRSKFIVVANFFIYAIVLLAYYITTAGVTLVDLSFGIVALTSARILNWNKDRLELKTEQMRNVYLISAFFALPYTFYFTVPEYFISISWIALAVVYYALSLVLNNRKYRWMSIYTFLLTLVYVAVIGLTSHDNTYKIISFLALGVTLIAISIIYTKRKVKNKIIV